MTDPRTVPLTDAQLENLELAARDSFGEDERSQALINGALSLITEVRRLRQSFGGDAQATDLAAIEARLAAATPGPWKGSARNVYVDDNPVWIVVCQCWTETLGLDPVPAPVVEANVDLIAHAPADLRALLAEVKQLRHDDAIWDKHSLVQIVTERDRLRSEVKRLQSLLETEQRAKWAAKQDERHWQEEAERLRLQVAQLAEALEKAIG